MSLSLIDQAHALFCEDRFATETTGISLQEVSLTADGRGGHAVCCLPIQEKHRNAKGLVMGGVLFTLADFAFAVACNLPAVAESGSLQWVSLDSTIHYLAAARGTLLSAEARCQKQGRTTCLYAIDITDDRHRLLAHVETTGMRTDANPCFPPVEQ